VKIYSALLTFILLTCPALAQDTFHGGANRAGVYSGPGPATLERVRWTFRAAGPIVTSAAVANGVVYVGSLSGHLYAIDQRTGTEQWHFKSSQPIASSPTVHDGSLYFVSSAGSLVALDLTTRAPRWVFVTESERKFEAKNLHGYAPRAQTIPDAWDVYTSSPAFADGKVYFGSGDGNVYSVDAKSGVLLWKFATRDVVHASPTVANKTVYIGSWDGNFYALDADTGTLRWTFAAGQDPAIHNQVGFQSSAAVVDGTVYVGCRDAHVYALDAATGRKKWDYPTSKSWVNATPAVRAGIVYVGTSDSSRLIALDAKTGRLHFNFDAKSYVFSSVALAGERAYFGSHNGRLYALEAQTGKLAAVFQTEAAKRDPLKLLDAEGRLQQEAFVPVFGDFQDMYIDFYRFVSVGAIFSSPVVESGVVYIGSTDGNLYAIG
jgi:outer membrane protein assembly factor BamB